MRRITVLRCGREADAAFGAAPSLTCPVGRAAQYGGGAERFPYFFELEERASPLFGDDLLHMVSGRQLLGTVDHVRPSMLEGADMPPRCYLAPPGSEAADLPQSASAWHGVPEEEDEIDAALEAEVEGAARAREAGALRVEADGSISLDDDGSAASRRDHEQRRLGLSGSATGAAGSAGAGQGKDPGPSWRERLAAFGRAPLPEADPLRTARRVDAETASKEARKRLDETRGPYLGAGQAERPPPPPHHAFQMLAFKYQGRTVATGYRTRTTLPPAPGPLGSLRGGAEVGLIYIYGEPGWQRGDGGAEAGPRQSRSAGPEGDGGEGEGGNEGGDGDSDAEYDDEEEEGEEGGPAAWAQAVVAEVGGIGVRADLSTEATSSSAREGEWARAWEVVRSGVNPFFPISERGAQPLEPTWRARPAESVSGREPGTDARGFYGDRLAADAAREGAPVEDPGVAARELDSGRTLLACVRGRGELVSGNFLRRVFNGEGVQTHSLLAWRTPGVRFAAWLQGDGLREAKVSRTSHAASRYWLFEPRAPTHDRGSWYLETNPAARIRRERHCLHPAVYVLTAAFDALDLERKDQRSARRRESWASRLSRWFR